MHGTALGGITGVLNGLAATSHAALAPLTAFRGALTGLFEVFLVGLAIEKSMISLSEMASFGEHAINLGAALGISGEEFVHLSEAMQIVGGNAEKLVNAFRLMSNAVRGAESNDMGKHADAFRKMEIDVEKFAEKLRTEPIEALKMLADGYTHTGRQVRDRRWC